MYSSGDINLAPFFYFLFGLAIIGAIAGVGGTIWGLWWLFTHVSIVIS